LLLSWFYDVVLRHISRNVFIEPWDTGGKPIGKKEARQFILSNYQGQGR
jgi:hypothetical protein